MDKDFGEPLKNAVTLMCVVDSPVPSLLHVSPATNRAHPSWKVKKFFAIRPTKWKNRARD